MHFRDCDALYIAVQASYIANLSQLANLIQLANPVQASNTFIVTPNMLTAHEVLWGRYSA